MKKNRAFFNNALVIRFLFVGGFLIRWFYILYTSIYERQHDVAYFDQDGHYGYISYILKNGLLPDFDPTTKFQFAHPPLHHLICSWWIDIQTNIFGLTFEEAAESLQYLTLLYSVALMYIAYKIFRYFGLKGLPLHIATCIVCFHPTFIFLSGSVNNDMLSTLLIAITLYFALKWYRDEKWKDLILSAITVGLALMTKSSAVFVALPIGFLILIKLIEHIKEHSFKRCFGQIATYGVISLPIGMWFHIYNLIRWNMPLFFVYPMPEGLPMYVGDVPVVKRLFDFSLGQFSSVYQQWLEYSEAGALYYNDYNPAITALKTSLFGEFVRNHTFDPKPEYRVYTYILFYSAAILAVGGFIYMIYNLARKFDSMYMEKLAMGAFFMFMMIGFYFASIKYPFECTMDFRYVPLTAVVGAFFIGVFVKQMTDKPKEERSRARSVAIYGTIILVAAFAMSSVMMFVGLYSINH